MGTWMWFESCDLMASTVLLMVLIKQLGKGYLDVIQDLRAHGIHCTSNGANWAAENDHLDVVRDLRVHGIRCTSRGADMAAENGHLDMVQDLRAHGIC